MHNQEEEAGRNREANLARLAAGARAMAKKPLKAVPLAALTAAFAATSPALTVERVFTGLSPLALSVLHVAFPAFLAFSYAALALGAVIMAGRPLEARKVWRELWFVFCQSGRYRPSDSPVLLSKARVKGTDVVEREFFSAGVPMGEWESRLDEIEHALNCHRGASALRRQERERPSQDRASLRAGSQPEAARGDDR